jgi:hypothetical protein
MIAVPRGGVMLYCGPAVHDICQWRDRAALGTTQPRGIKMGKGNNSQKNDKKNKKTKKDSKKQDSKSSAKK